MYTPKKIHSGFVGLMFLLAAVILFFAYARPAQREAAQIKTQVAALNRDILTLKGQSTGTSTVARLSEVDAREIGQKIPQKLEQDFIITELNRIAKATNVTFNALSFSLLQSGTLPAVTISAGFQGASGDTVRFLKMLETDTRKFVVRDAGISRAQTESGVSLVNLNITAQAFYRTNE